MIGFGQYLCSKLSVNDIVINSSNMTIDITIYDGNIGGQPYPYIAYTIDNLGDTIQIGSLNSFGNLGLDTSLYSYSLNSLPSYPLTVCYAYGMNSDTCILIYNSTTVSWNCVEGFESPDFCSDPGDGTGLFTTLEGCQEFCNATSIIDPNKGNKKLKNITNLLGEEILIRKNTPMFYIYDNGSVEKKIIIE